MTLSFCESPAGFLRYIAYFGIILVAALNVSLVLLKHGKKGNKFSKIFLSAALLAFFSTWWHLGMFLYSDFSHFKEITPEISIIKYLCTPVSFGREDLFVQAYRQVSLSPSGWWWSSRLLRSAFSSITLMNFISSTLLLKPHQILSFLIVDFGIANSVSLCLLFSLLIMLPKSNGSVPLVFGSFLKQLLIFVSFLLISAAATFLNSTEDVETFGYSLLAMHIGLLLPIVITPSSSTSIYYFTSQRLMLMAMSAVSLVAYIVETMALPSCKSMDFRSCLINHIHAGFVSSCQSSISWDYVFTFVACATFIISREVEKMGYKSIAIILSLLLILDVGTVLLAYLAISPMCVSDRCTDVVTDGSKVKNR